MEDNHFNNIFILKTVFFFFLIHRVYHFSQIRDGRESNTFNSQKAPAPWLAFSIINSLSLQVVKEDSGRPGRGAAQSDSRTRVLILSQETTSGAAPSGGGHVVLDVCCLAPRD